MIIVANILRQRDKNRSSSPLAASGIANLCFHRLSFIHHVSPYVVTLYSTWKISRFSRERDASNIIIIIIYCAVTMIMVVKKMFSVQF